MNRLHSKPFFILYILMLSLSLCVSAGDTDQQNRPNIILFIADDLGYGELGCQGNPQIPTPYIDAISNNGVRFTSGYVTAPNCSPSRAGMLTGRIGTRFGYENNPIGDKNELPGHGLPSGEKTIARALHDVGYATALIGKWHQDRPFFLQLAYNAVHSPMQGADAYMEIFKDIEDIQRRIFAAMLANMDSSVGEVMEKLRSCGLEENTLVVFLSDNGGPTLELTSSNLPLRGGKGSMYEGGLRIPFMMQWKNRIPAGSTYDHAISSLDLFPTFASAAGASLPGHLDGVDLMPYMTGEISNAPHDSFFWRQRKRAALRMGEWKIVFNPQQDEWELYNLADDLGETENLAQRHAEIAKGLIEEYYNQNKQMEAPIF